MTIRRRCPHCQEKFIASIAGRLDIMLAATFLFFMEFKDHVREHEEAIKPGLNKIGLYYLGDR